MALGIFCERQQFLKEILILTQQLRSHLAKLAKVGQRGAEVGQGLLALLAEQTHNLSDLQTGAGHLFVHLPGSSLLSTQVGDQHGGLLGKLRLGTPLVLHQLDQYRHNWWLEVENS